jgi:pimeloyl-ACP methyl ester carboxylesterase
LAQTLRTSNNFVLTMHSIKTGKFLGRIPYAQFGDGRNPVLVLNGGQGFMMKSDDSRMFKDAKRLERILPSERSFVLLGYDPHPSVVTVDGLAAEVAQIVDLHFGGRTDLIGISYGGVVAAALARQFPAKVERLVLLASAHRFSEEGSRRIKRQIQLVEAGNPRALLREFSTMFRSPILNWLVALRMRISGAAMSRKFGNHQTIILYLQAMLKSAATGADLGDIRARSLIVAGSLDQFFGDAIDEAGACIPHARLSVFKGETHMVPIERGNAVKRALTTFLSD